MLQRFFWMCSGADTDILNQCPKSEQIKQAGIGGTVFFTAVMAFIAATYALFTIFNNLYYAIFFGIIWGLLIFNLDRFIVSTIKKRDHFYSELLQAIPRFLLAILIAIVISKPLELKIFEKEVNRVLLEEKNNLTLANKDLLAKQFAPEIERRTLEIAHLKNEVALKEQQVESLYQTFIEEAEGTSGTLKLGKGPVYQEKRQKHDTMLAELQELRTSNNIKIIEKEEELAALHKAYQIKVNETQPIIDNFDGLMARINALDKLPWLPSFFIFLLFLAIETAPIIAKLLSPKGIYDIRVQDEEESVISWTAQKATQRNILSATDAIINDKIYEDITQEEELSQLQTQKS